MCCQGDRTGSHNCIKFTSKQSRIIKLLEKTRLPYKGKEDKMTKQVLKNDILSIRNSWLIEGDYLSAVNQFLLFKV